MTNRPPRRSTPVRAAWVALLAALAGAGASAQTCLTVEVQQVRPQQGVLMLAAHGDPQQQGRAPIAQIRVPAGGATTRFEWCLPDVVRDAPFAIWMFQDLDSDGKMGRNLVGMPTEPWGASGQPGMMGPEWATTKVVRPADGSPVVVRLSQ